MNGIVRKELEKKDRKEFWNSDDGKMVESNEDWRMNLELQSNSVIANSSGPAIFVRYNRVNLCSKMTNLF